MEPGSLRTKRPRDEPGDTGVSAANGRSKAKRACPDSATDAAAWSSGEEDAQSEVSVETDRPAVTVFDWSDTTPAEPLTIEVRILRRTWTWLQAWTLKDAKGI